MVFNDPDSLVSSVVSTEGTPERDDGGFTWSGRGFFSSGVDHCNWLIAAIDLKPEEPPGDRRWFLLRREDFDIIDDWHTVGLRGSGSKTIEIKNVFVPDERVVEQKPLSEGKGMGAQLHGGQLYCAAMDFTFSLPLGAPVIGIARALLKAFEERMRSRLTGGNQRLAGEQAATLTRFAKAGAEIEAARALLLETARKFDAGEDVTMAASISKYFATEMVCRVADRVVQVFGARGYIADYSGVERLYRDVRGGRMAEGTSQIHLLTIAREMLKG
jgi:3-hydroxy-9,10-secoandrosta-1,3,5(10)-triene-9,17-dione monooxygenase